VQYYPPIYTHDFRDISFRMGAIPKLHIHLSSDPFVLPALLSHL
jgi:hypothetical protein